MEMLCQIRISKRPVNSSSIGVAAVINPLREHGDVPQRRRGEDVLRERGHVWGRGHVRRVAATASGAVLYSAVSSWPPEVQLCAVEVVGHVRGGGQARGGHSRRWRTPRACEVVYGRR